jgi:vacuolar-type H+-ATPase subunit E/Vma4
MEYKYKVVDLEEIKMRLDVIKQELKQWVQLYYDRLEKLFTRGNIKEVEQRWRCPNQNHK